MKTLDDAIMELKNEIEKKQKLWINHPSYDGCMAYGVRGMIDALDIITGKEWFMRDGTLFCKEV